MNKMPANNMQYVKATPVISLNEGQELLVRVYPWYNGAASGKTICLSDLTIHGIAVDASSTAIKEVGKTGQPVAAYDLCGRKIADKKSAKGQSVTIVRMNDGTTKKVIY